MKKPERVILEDKFAEESINRMLDELYNRTISNDSMLKAINSGLLGTPVISSISTGDEGGVPYVLAYADPIDYAENYVWAIRKDGTANWTQHTTKDSSNKFIGLGYSITYQVRVKALGMFFNSDWSATSLILTEANPTTTALPDPATGLTVTGMFKHLFLSWTNPDIPNIFCWEIWRSDTNDRSLAAKVGEALTTVYSDLIGAYAVTRYYWIRARNTAGTYSAWYPTSATGGVSGTTAQVATADYTLLSVTNAVIAALAVDEAKIANLAVAEGKIGNLAVGTLKIGADAVTYAKRQDVYSGSIDVGALTAGLIYNYTEITHSLGRNVMITTGVDATAVTNVNYGIASAAYNVNVNKFRITVCQNVTAGTVYYTYW